MLPPILDLSRIAQLLADKDCRVFDCSFDFADPDTGRSQFEAGHIRGARYLHLDDDLAGKPNGVNGRHPLPDPQDFASRMREEGLRKDQQVVAYDNSGGSLAARLWWLLRWGGHDKVVVLDASVDDCATAGLEIDRGPTGPIAAGDFEISGVRSQDAVDCAFVLENLYSGEYLVVDARAAARFSGETLMMDPVPGHIPSASNRPFTENLDSEGRFKPPEDLRREFERLIGDLPPSKVIMQCGSGITACHNLLAMHHAGLAGALLYPGSWSEWSSDPSRPVERGI